MALSKPFAFHQPLSLRHLSSEKMCTACAKPIMVIAMACLNKCHTYCMACYESQLASDNFSINVTKHPHKLYQTNYRNPSCDECMNSSLKEAYSCEICDYDMCEKCAWNFRRVGKSATNPAPVPITSIPTPVPTFEKIPGESDITVRIPKCPPFRIPQTGRVDKTKDDTLYPYHPILEPWDNETDLKHGNNIKNYPIYNRPEGNDYMPGASVNLTHDLKLPTEGPNNCNIIINRSRMYVLADEVYKYLKETNNKDNFFMSPYSIHIAFSLVLAGCTPSSITEFEIMLSVIGANNVPRKYVLDSFSSSIRRAQNRSNELFEVANALFSRPGKLTKEYKRIVYDELSSETRDLTTENDINAWCSEKTKGKISNIVDDGFITDDMIAVLVNAIYFNAKWQSPFKSENTKKDVIFTRENGTVRTCDMMYQKTYIPFVDTDNFRACSLSYKGSQYSAWFALPKDSDPSSIHDLKISDIHDAICKTGGTSRMKGVVTKKVSLYCPKFRAEFGPFEMSDVLKRMGVFMLFSGERTASGDDGFSVMVGERPVDATYISNIIHKAVCDVDEEGTVAAAVTLAACRVTSCGVGPDPIIFRMDRPFVFMIVDNYSDECMFAGKILEP